MMDEDFAFKERIRVYDYPGEYWADIDVYERNDDIMTFGHLGFEKFNQTIYRKSLQDWKRFREGYKYDVWAQPDPKGDVRLWAKFISRFGFQPTGVDLECKDGVCRPLFISKAGRRHVQ